MKTHDWLCRVGCALIIAGCAAETMAPAFDLHLPPAGKEQQAILEALVSAPVPASRAAQPRLVAVGAAGVSMHDASSGAALWSTPARPDSEPLLLGELVVYAEGNRLRALAASDGRERFSVPLARQALLGAALGAGGRLFVSSADRRLDSATRGASVLALDASDGSVLWERAVPGRLGAPAVRGDFVLVPWNYQHLSALDARSGRERLRLDSKTDVVRFVSSQAAGVAVGDRGLRLLAAGTDPLGGPTLALDGASLPGQPSLMPSGYEPLPTPGSAESRIVVAFALAVSTPGAPAQLRNDGSYLVFFRHVFGFEPSGALRFARVLGSDAVQAQVTAAGLLVVTRSGESVLLDARDGRPRGTAALGFEPLAASLEATELRGSEPTEPALPMRAMLSEVALDADSRLVPTRAYAVRALARLPEPEVTRDLLDIYRQGSTPQGLATVIAEVLRQRASGAEHLIGALGERQDFLEQTRPAPLEVIAPALENMGAKQALPLLVERMLDHETPLQHLPALVRAVGTLGGREALQPLEYLLQLYRADSSFAAHPDALLEAARAIARIAGEAGRAPLEELAAAPLTHPALVDEIGRLWLPASEQVAAIASAPPTAADSPRAGLDRRDVHSVFAEHADELRHCVLEELDRNPRLGQLRIAFVAQPDGTPRAMSLSPNGRELRACLIPRLNELRFPAFDGERHLVDYVVSVRAFADEPSTAAPTPAEGPWWQAGLARGSTEPAQGEPWWRDQNSLQALVAEAARRAGAANTSTATPAVPAPPTSTAAPTAPAPPTQPGATGSQAPAQDEWWVPAQ